MMHRRKKGNGMMIVLGASTGGPLSVREVLRGLPGNFPVGIAYVQHIEDVFYGTYAEWLDKNTPLRVRIAENSDYPGPGEVLIAPSGCHLVFSRGRLVYEDSPPVMNLRPCADRLFITAAEEFEDGLIGVIMTGMGSDGAAGCVEIKSRGGYTIAQNEETSIVFGMARAAIEAGGISEVLPLGNISGRLIELTRELNG
jgi:two-component system, chemotaxis family, protein-glutamate methylesterase/glutaminase